MKTRKCTIKKPQKNKKSKRAIELLNASGFGIEKIEWTRHSPESQEIIDILNRLKAKAPLKENLELEPSEIPSLYDMAHIKLRAFGVALGVLLTIPENVNRLNSDIHLRKVWEKSISEYLQTYGRINKSDASIAPTIADYFSQLRAFSEFAKVYGILSYAPFNILHITLRMKDLLLQLRKEELLKEQGLAMLLSEIHADKSNAELRAIFQRYKIKKHNIDKFFREHPSRKGRQGNPEEWWIYHDKDGFYYDIATSDTPDTIVEREVFDANEAYTKVETLNKKEKGLRDDKIAY